VLSRLQPFTKAKIPQFYLPVIKKYVLGFDIPVHNIEPVQDFKCFQKLPENGQCFFLGIPSLSFQCIHESASITKFIDKIVIISRLEVILILYYEIA
jgi:hypothetical protein